MDITESSFWQNVLLAILLIPYCIGIGISTYYAQKQKRSEMVREAHRNVVKKD
jgi:hypothetical protein